jgi:hypothetical protein
VSYDVNLEIDTGGKHPATVGNDDMNYTYNCAPMFRRALGGNGINNLHGELASDMLPRLRAAVSHMAENPDIYEPMNPANGWGDYKTALQFLEHILLNAAAHPKATFRVS